MNYEEVMIYLIKHTRIFYQSAFGLDKQAIQYYYLFPPYAEFPFIGIAIFQPPDYPALLKYPHTSRSQKKH